MISMRRGLGLAALSVLFSCSSSSGDGGGATANPDETDVRVPIPPADAKYIDFVGTEAVIGPGEEKMYCVYTTYNGPDTAFYNQEALQGKFGHHAVLLSTKDSKPDGTTIDCTDMSQLAAFEPFSITEELPAGVGVFLQHGKKMVMQFHYVNSSRKPIRVRDVARLHKRELADVKSFAAVWVTNTSDFKVSPRASASQSFDCVLDRDVDLLLLGGHMHEYGTSFKAEIGPSVNELKPLYTVDQWKQDYRDHPPMQLHTNAPMHLAKGTVIRTTCAWNNPGDTPIAFPQEMCTTFGYASGIKEPFVCDNGKITAQ
jgi:hypothetical protein